MAPLVDLFKAVLGICETPALDGALWTSDGKEVTVKLAEATALAPAGAAARLEGAGLPARVLIVHAGGDEYLAIENRCTHVGHRRLDPVEGKRELRCCSVGHSVFDHEGSRMSGPAKDPLRRFPIEKRGDELVVALT